MGGWGPDAEAKTAESFGTTFNLRSFFLLLLQITLAKKHFSVFEAKNQVLSEMIQNSPNGPKIAPNGQKCDILIILDHFGPL